MRISIISLFPEMFTPILETSIVGRAQKKGFVTYELIDLRKFGEGSHLTVDDTPYGGGAGMVLKADVLKKALLSISIADSDRRLVVLLTPSGSVFSQKTAQIFSELDHLILICGHYEGVDQRFIDNYVDLEISIGDYVLTGGELPAMILIDSVIRLIPGVLGKELSFKDESFSDGLLEYPHFTRPQEFEGAVVPEVLTSGNHQRIAEWRKMKSLEKTAMVRPDLLKTTKE